MNMQFVKEKDTKNLLKMENITKIYSGTVALNKANLEIVKGEIHGIIGKNGAGKSTLINIIAGVIKPSEGQIYFEDKKFNSLTRNVSKDKGISIVSQEPYVVPEFTVAETLFSPNFSGHVISRKRLNNKAKEIVERADYNVNVKMKMKDLPISSRQFVLILKAFYVDKAKLIILDEASASLAKKDQDSLHKIIKQGKQQEKSIIVISHKMEEIMNICDKVTVLRNGQTIATKKINILNEQELSSYIMGDNSFNNVEKVSKTSTDQNKDTVLEVSNLTFAESYMNINFKLAKGEIIGLAGLRGSGRTEILKGIAGIDERDMGQIKIEGKKEDYSTPSEALEKGIVYLPEERDEEGLILTNSVKDNLVITCLNDLKEKVWINRNKEAELADNLINRLNIKVASPNQMVSNLSGGNKQKVVVGKIMNIKPKVYLLDEPTKGIDIGVKLNILKIIKNYLSKSAGIILTSPELKDLLKICDRILVIYNGKLIKEFSRNEFNEEKIYLAMQNVVEGNCKKRSI